MITLRYPLISFRVTLWLGELPDAIFPAEAVIERLTPASVGEERPQARAAAEMFRVTEPRGHYGLLGATFTPDGSSLLSVRVVTSEQEGQPYRRPGARTSSWTGQVGLPREYAEAVIAGALRTLATDPLGGGELRFDCAAHHIADSNNHTFSGLAALVTRLLQPDSASMTEERLAALAEACLRR